MILVDANLLLYAYDSLAPHHEAAKRWLKEAFTTSEPIGISWVTILAFLRISTHPRVLQRPLSVAESTTVVSEWLERPMVTVLNPGERHWEILRDLMAKGQAQGPLIMDAHLAALAIEHGAVVATTDRDFTRFPGLRTLNPLDA